MEKNYSSTLSLTLALYGVGGLRNAPAALPPGKTQYYCMYTVYIVYISSTVQRNEMWV